MFYNTFILGIMYLIRLILSTFLYVYYNFILIEAETKFYWERVITMRLLFYKNIKVCLEQSNVFLLNYGIDYEKT